MLAALQEAFGGLLRSSFPDLFGGATPAVKLEFQADEWSFDPSSADPAVGEPVPDDATDLLPFDPSHPEGPYTLSQQPYPGPRRVYLKNPAGDRQALGPAEVEWNATEARSFLLRPKPARVLAGWAQVEVLYGITAVFTRVRMAHRQTVLLTASDAAALERAEALALAVFVLNRGAIQAGGAFTQSGGYQAQGAFKNLKLLQGAAAAAGSRTLVLDAELELKLSRNLGEGEGRPIVKIVSPGKGAGAGHPVEIDVGVQS